MPVQINPIKQELKLKNITDIIKEQKTMKEMNDLMKEELMNQY